MSNVHRIFMESKKPADFSKKYTEYLTTLLKNLNHDKVGEIIEILIEAGKNGKTIYFIGNGGSATTASHFACDLGKGTKTVVNKFKAHALADNFATFTAYANDVGYENVFSKQLENVLNPGDVLVSISASGNSPNLVNAVEYAKTIGAKTVSLLGFDGGKLKNISDHHLVIETPHGEYGPVEDLHMVLDHLMTEYIYRLYAYNLDFLSENRPIF
jgi:D-sedoheptulose 7-phosphate isomerase